MQRRDTNLMRVPEGGVVLDTVARVTELMAERGISLYKLSKISDVPYSSLKYTVQENGQLSVDTIERICKGLNIPLAQFFAEVR